MNARQIFGTLAFVLSLGTAAFVGRYFVSSPAIPILLVVLLGGVTFLLVWTLKHGPRLSLARQVLIGGAVTMFLPCTAIFIWAWSTGQSANPAGGSSGSGGALDALLFAYFWLIVGLPAFLLWSVVCIVGAMRRPGAGSGGPP